MNIKSDELKPKIVGAGLLALDVVLSANPSRRHHAAGGTCGNVLVALSLLGWEAYPVARMNGDFASSLVQADLGQWGVHSDFLQTGAPAGTPIIVERISGSTSGSRRSDHSFSWSCPDCGSGLPRFRPVTVRAAQELVNQSFVPSVFYFDRLSRSALHMARAYAESGSIIVFEPAAIGERGLLEEALSVSHIVKYATEQRSRLFENDNHDIVGLVEIETLGRNGLRLRSRLHSTDSDSWTSLPAPKVDEIVDTAGAGDWATAGIIATMCSGGMDGFLSRSAEEILAACDVGQSLAAWACQFEGPRGGMYGSLHTLTKILDGTIQHAFDMPEVIAHTVSVGAICPKCAPTTGA